MGRTTEILQRLGAKDLPLIMRQSNLHKCIREPKGSKSAHQIDRKLIEQLPQAIEKPVLVIDNPQKSGLLVLTDQTDFKGRGIVVSIHLQTSIYGQAVNEVKSIYGREELKEFLLREKDYIVYLDKQKAKFLPPSIEKQYLKAPTRLDYNKNITDFEQTVNPQNEKSTRASPEIVKDIRKSGFQATKSLIKNIRQLDALNGRTNSMRDICSAYKNGCTGMNQEQTDLVEKIAKECREQELARMQLPER